MIVCVRLRLNIWCFWVLFKCIVHIYGLPREISTVQNVEVELKDGAGMTDVITAIKEKIPAFDGQVFREGENRLMDLFKFNINGQFYFNGMDFKLQDGDIAELALAGDGCLENPVIMQDDVY